MKVGIRRTNIKLYWSDKCDKYESTEKRKQHFRENKLCFNCGKKGHQEGKCFSRGCYHCKAKHHTSLCDKENKGSVLTGFSPSVEETLPPIILLCQMERHCGDF